MKGLKEAKTGATEDFLRSLIDRACSDWPISQLSLATLDLLFPVAVEATGDGRRQAAGGRRQAAAAAAAAAAAHR